MFCALTHVPSNPHLALRVLLSLRERIEVRATRFCAQSISGTISPWSEVKKESVGARDVADHMSILRAQKGIAELEPATELFRRAIDWARPAIARERAFDFSKARVLPQAQQRHARTLREEELEIARVRIAHNYIGDQAGIWRGQTKLAGACLPALGRFDKLMTRKRGAAI